MVLKPKRIKLILLTGFITGLFSCGQNSPSTADTVFFKKPQTITTTQSQQIRTRNTAKNTDTRYCYTDSTGRSLIIQNSFPKSGIHYTDPTGKKYVYAVFWSRIINETEHACELTIGFPAASARLSSAGDVCYRIFLPPDTMTTDKEPLYDYGLSHVKQLLDESLAKPASLKRVVNRNDSIAFYFVTLSDKGVSGPLRTGLSVKGQGLSYRINDEEIDVGKSISPI